MAFNKNTWYWQAMLSWISAAIGWPVGNVFYVANSSDTDEWNYQTKKE